jgi:hypothetical protein
MIACGGGRDRIAESAPLLVDVIETGRFTDPDVVESSGIAPSGVVPGLFWTFNDSGHDAELFAIDSTGSARGRVRVTNAHNRDWEAIASGPCPAGICLFIGDVGDNAGARPYVRLYRVPEPAPGDSTTVRAEVLTVNFVDGPHDIESLWVAPDSAVYLLTKRPLPRRASGAAAPAHIHRVAPTAWMRDTLRESAIFDTLPLYPSRAHGPGWLTDAALSPNAVAGGYELAVRSYERVWIFRVDSTTWRPEALRAECRLDGLHERRSGEGLTVRPTGRLLFTAEGRHARLHMARCPEGTLAR